MKPSSNGYMLKILLCKVQRTLHKRVREFAVRLFLLVMSKATFINYQQHDVPNMHETRTTIDMSKWSGKGHEVSTLQKELQAPKQYQA